MKSRKSCWGAVTYSPTTAACFPATPRAGGWVTGESGPNACEGGGVADERPFGDLPRGHFGAILADPPWKYVTYSERGQGRSASQHYGVMTFEEIATLPVRDVAAPDAWLFLWVPSPHLPFGLQLIERWGFRYSGKAFAWAKQNPSGVGWHMGTGFTTRKNSEDCLLGRRGRPPIKAHDVRELIVAPRRKHSQKPDEQYARNRAPGRQALPRAVRTSTPSWLGCLGRRGRQVRIRIRRPRRLRQSAEGSLPRHSRARCCGRSTVGAEMTRRTQPEAALQRSVIQHLTWRARPGAFFFHVPLGGYRTRVESAILKAIGTVAGVPDIICIFGGRCYALELKAERGRLTDVQRVVHERLREAGANVAVAHGIDQALAQLERWQLLRGTSPSPPIRFARSASRASR